MIPIVEDFVTGGIPGMLSSLRGWKRSKHVDIHIRSEDV